MITLLLTLLSGDAVVFGDSMTRAVFADTSMLNTRTLETKDDVDDWESAIADRPWFSWFNGMYGYSVANRVGYHKTYNRAVSGAETHNVISQYNKFVAENAGINNQPLDAFIAIGPNDICNPHVKNAKMSAKYMIDTLDTMMKQTNWTFYVTDLIDMSQLRKFNNDRGAFGLKCSSIKRYIPACRRYVLEMTNDAQDLRMREYWDAWRDVEAFILMSGRGKFLRIFEGFELDRKYMAADCFHPNWRGEWKIADLILEALGK